jgi:hypothetical protein
LTLLLVEVVLELLAGMVVAELDGILKHRTHLVVEADAQRFRGKVQTLSLRAVVEVLDVVLAVSMDTEVRVVARLVLVLEMELRQTVRVVHKPQEVLLDQVLRRPELQDLSIRAAMVQ